MELITCLKETLKYIENNLENKIDTEKISQNVYVSRYYLQKSFQIITGYSLGEYIRNRRLYEAAKELCRSDVKIIDLSYRFCYETPESFTKAFTRFHGSSPAAVKKDPSLIRTFMPLNIRIEISGGNKMDYVVSPMWQFKVIGFEKTISCDTAFKDIPLFWDEICEKYCTHTIYAGLPPANECEQAIIDNCIGEYGVCVDGEENGTLRYMIAGKYTGGAVPEGMKVFEFPASEWAKFSCTGPVPEAIHSMTEKIFREWLPGNADFEAAGNFSIEWYSCDGNKNDDDYRSAVWIPVKRYKDEAEKLWGNTSEFKENEKKTNKRTKEENDAVNAGMTKIFSRFGKIKNTSPSGAEAQKLVSELQNYISDNYYNCTKEILASLGRMYTGDSRFKANIDRTGGEGTAEFASKAIEYYTNS